MRPFLNPMMFGGKIKGKAFSLSGGFDDSSLDGWTGTGSFVTSPRRSGTGALLMASSGSRTLVIPASVARFCAITVTVWHRGQSGGSFRSIRRVMDGNTLQLASVNNATTTFAVMSGSFDNTSKEDISIQIYNQIITGGGNSYYDDWSVTGVPL